MKNVLSKILLMSLMVILFTQINLIADRKKFARSYTAHTLPANAIELEFWQTGRFEKETGSYYRWQPRFEIEYGVTDRFTSSLYLNLNEVKSSGNSYSPKSLGISTTSVEFRYRLTNQDEFFIDPAIYFEFGYGGDKLFYEPKLLLSKQIGNFSTVLNIVSEIERNITANALETKFEISAGVMYDFSKNLSVGLEFRNHRNFEDIYKKEESQATFFGPTFSLHSDKLYFVLNFLTQLSGSPESGNGLDLSGHEKYEIRTIIGIEL